MHNAVLAVGDYMDVADAAQKAKSSFSSTLTGIAGWVLLVTVLIWVVVMIAIFIRDFRQWCKEKREQMNCNRERENELEQLREVKENISTNMKLREREIKEKKKEQDGLRFYEYKRKIKIEAEIEALEKADREDTASLYRNQKKIEQRSKELAEGKRRTKDIDRKYKDKRDKSLSFVKKSFTAISFLLVVIFCFRENMVVCAQNFLAGSFFREEIQEDASEQIPEESAQEIETVSSEAVEMTDTEVAEKQEGSAGWDAVEFGTGSFILLEKHLNRHLEEEIETLIFSEDRTGQDFAALGKELEEMEKDAKGVASKKDPADAENEKLMEDILKWIADDLEKPFLEQIEAKKNEISKAEYGKTPDSGQLESIMEERKKAIRREDSGPYRRKLYFQLANDFQMMAQECQQQGKDGETILYYYGMSIYYSCMALAQEKCTDMDPTDDIIVNYIAGRYRDIRDDVDCRRRNESKAIYQAIMDFQID